MIAGVCGGVAEYLGVDPTLVRIGAVLLSLAGGLGIVAYGAAWLLVPADEGDERERPTSVQAILIVVAAFILLGWFDIWDDGPTVPFVLLAVGAVLVWGGRQGDGPRALRPMPPAAPAPPMPPPMVEHAGPGRWSWSPPPAAMAPPAPGPRRAPRHVGRAIAVGVGGLFLAFGAITGAVAASGWIAPTLFLGLSLAGFGLLIATGSFWGWSRPLTFGAMAVVLALALASVVDVPLEGGVGERTGRFASATQLPAEEHLAAGHLVLDLSAVEAVELAGDEERLEATVATGELEVLVPAGVTVEVHAEAGVGQVDVLGQTDDGVSAEIDHVFEIAGAGRLQLDLEVGIGHVEVTRVG
jgi:phage shock protein PspC (stress-responsive transcriptional regulator)